jgi:CheY-like chemotaxis protein
MSNPRDSSPDLGVSKDTGSEPTQVESDPWPKVCACKQSWTRESWRALRLIGTFPENAPELELRECACGSTLSMSLEHLEMDEDVVVAKAPQRLRVLIIDDDIALLRTMGRLLRREFTVTEMSSAEDALVAVAQGAMFDALLVDVHLPGFDGISFFRELRRVRPDLAMRVIFMTGGIPDAADAAFLASIDNEVLAKPFRLELVRARVQRVAKD